MPGATKKSGKPVGAVVAAVRVLRCLRETSHPLNASQIARALGMYRGTTINILRTLEAEGLVAWSEATRTYSLGIRLLEFAHSILRTSGVMDLVRPLLFSIAEKYQVSAYLTRVMDDSLVLLDSVGTGFRIDAYMSVGRRYPSLAGAPGAVIGAFSHLDNETIRRGFEETEWFKQPSWEDFEQRIVNARTNGYAVDRGERWQGLCQISAPVLDGEDELRLLLTIVGLTHDLGLERIDEIARDAVVCSKRISEALPLLRID